ncbi:deoxyuridine 5'-triphosphate nucleotidohydrolase [Lactuca sativa]|uniref:Deoxyuridine 5'-triphosphate nucleotidohydrolase n=1 Tax=Lactuca sativa TaxID=4236 RepID=A0A9R1UQX4_LACSA|nr:deoxyuridine 5'-triphosphate nucleotidohydrolase [Lactuca sativa]KAJ0192050.1 hypothetical protein LSAT_V11C800419320 [Lactuca sativa]
MAGTLGAIPRTLSLAGYFIPNKPYPYRHYRHPTSRFSLFNFSLKPSFLRPVSAMSHNNGSPEIEGPIPKVQKIDDRNGNSDQPLFRVKKLSEKAILPARGSSLAAGYDLSSAIDTKVPARGKALVPTDLSIAVPEGTYARIAPRSGLTWKHSIDVGAGVIDADYRGPVGVILFNHSDSDFEVKTGDRIAQLIIEKIITPEVVEVDDLDSTVRGAGGFGSTGV